MINNIIFNLLAKFINADVIGGYVRAAVATLFGVLATWLGSKVPFLSALLTPDAQAWVAATVTAFLVGLWSQISKQTTAPTATQVVNVITQAATQGVVPAATAAAVKADPTIAMPDKAVGNL